MKTHTLTLTLTLTGRVLNKGKKGTLPSNLYEDITLRYDQRTRQPNGVRYRNTLVMIRGRDGNFVQNPAARVAYPNFMRDVRAASALPETTNEGQTSAQISKASGQLAPDPETIDSVRRDLARELEEAKDEAITPGVEPLPPQDEEATNQQKGKRGRTLEEAKGLSTEAIKKGADPKKAWRCYDLRKKNIISGDEQGEILGLFGVRNNNMSESPNEDVEKKIETLEKEQENYTRMVEEAKKQGKGERAATYLELSKWCGLEADSIVFELDLPLRSEEGIKTLEEVVENNKQVTLEKVKKFLKENGLALAGVSIMLASFVTAVVSLVKSGARAAKSAGSKVADTFKELSRKLGPLLGPLFSLVGSVFGLLARGTGWLVNNLWVLFLLVAYLVYDYGK